MADVTISDACVNLQPGGSCCIREGGCPFAQKCAWGDCSDARLAARVKLAPDEFVVLVGVKDRKPVAGRFPLRRCRATAVEESAGVHTTSLLTSLGDAALLDAVDLPGGSVILTTRDGNASVMWRGGHFVPA